MSHQALTMSMHKILRFYFYIFIAFHIPVGGGIIPVILKSNKESRLNITDSKLWMNFIEKRLEAMNYMNSYLEFYKEIFLRRLFKELPASCKDMLAKQTDGVQVRIYGNICGTSRGGQEEGSLAELYCSKLRSMFNATAMLS